MKGSGIGIGIGIGSGVEWSGVWVSERACDGLQLVAMASNLVASNNP